MVISVSLCIHDPERVSIDLFGGLYLSFLNYGVVRYVLIGLYLLFLFVLVVCFDVFIISNKNRKVNNFFKNYILNILIIKNGIISM